MEGAGGSDEALLPLDLRYRLGVLHHLQKRVRGLLPAVRNVGLGQSYYNNNVGIFHELVGLLPLISSKVSPME